MIKRIFTFWEPKNKMPAYVRLCIDTWKKFLPDYEIIILDYKNLNDWLPEDYFDKILYKKFSLPMQADAIRCALLKNYGGIWMDADTIITSEKVSEIFQNYSEFLTIGTHIGLIAAGSDSKIVNEWDKQVKIKIEEYKKFKTNILNLIFHPKISKKYDAWDYLGNSIINPLINAGGEYKHTSLDVQETGAYPEKNPEINPNITDSAKINYKNFYFVQNYNNIPAKAYGIICLHNSWTPKQFKKMNEQEFLKQNCTLSNIIREILYN